MGKKWMARIAATVTVGLALGGLAGGSAVASADPPTHYTANICGAWGCGFQGNPSVLSSLVSEISGYGNNPAALGLQEACLSQAAVLDIWLNNNVAGGYQSTMWAQLSGSAAGDACNGGSSYGVASFAVGPSNTPVDNWRFDSQDTLGADADSETRGFSCILGFVFTFYTSCSAHMVNDNSSSDGDPAYSLTQFGEYVNEEIVSRATGGNAHAVWWGGDLYVLPGQVTTAVPGFSYSNHLEADRCFDTTYNRWTHRLKDHEDDYLNKFDWLFRSGPGRSCGADAVLTPSSVSAMFDQSGWTHPSDHRIEAGRW